VRGPMMTSLLRGLRILLPSEPVIPRVFELGELSGAVRLTAIGEWSQARPGDRYRQPAGYPMGTSSRRTTRPGVSWHEKSALVGAAALLVVSVVAIAAIGDVAGPSLASGVRYVAIVLAVLAAFMLVDRALGVTGFARSDAHHSFDALARRRRWTRVRRRLRGRSEARLELLRPELEETANRRDLGRQTIPLASIVGTTEADKAKDFDAAFCPPPWSRARWETMWLAVSHGIMLPPISVYRVGDRHYIRDGHHRVSIPHALKADAIDADVVELIELPPSVEAAR
jgi:hypothetical protein